MTDITPNAVELQLKALESAGHSPRMGTIPMIRAQAARIEQLEAVIEQRRASKFEDCIVDLSGGDYRAIFRTQLSDGYLDEGIYNDGDRIFLDDDVLDMKDLHILSKSAYAKVLSAARADALREAADKVREWQAFTKHAQEPIAEEMAQDILSLIEGDTP